jgi:CPA2 family monovalent cation:H+ antiporter-2
MHSIDLVVTLAGALGAALLFGLIAHKLKLPPIVGYLMAGVFVGPSTPGFRADEGLARQLAEVGVVLLLFGVGLEFHLEHLLAVKHIAVPAAILQVVILTAISTLAMHAFGWELGAGALFGIALSISSTVIVMRMLAERRELHTPAGHLAVGWLVVEDLITVLVLVLLPGLSGKSDTGPALTALFAILKLGLLVGFTFLVGGRAIPWLLNRVVDTGSRELFTLSVLAIALGIGLGAAELFGASMALGAFLAGLVVGRSDFASRAATEALPMRDAFAVLFFVSVGMLFEPSFLVREPLLVAAALGLVVIAKPVVSTALLLLLRRPARQAVSIGAGRGQIGEFSFILGALGKELGVFSTEAESALVAASILSIVLSPTIFRFVPQAGAWLPEHRPSEALAMSEAPHSRSERRHRAVIVGFGPVGQSVARLLGESGIEPSVVELNLETVRKLRAEGLRAVYGDASRRETLEEAGVRDAVSLILSAPIEGSAAGIVRQVRELNPKLFVVARCGYLAEIPELQRAGADAAFSGEGEIALAMTEFVLRRLGATPEQIDHERERVHGELRGVTDAKKNLISSG